MRFHFPGWLRYTTNVDRIIIAFCSILSFGSLIIPFTAEAGDIISVEINGKLRYEGKLFASKELTLVGEWGAVTIQTDTKGVRISRSSCPQQICVKQGWRKKSGDVIVCVPNRLIVNIHSSHARQKNPMDTITR